MKSDNKKSNAGVVLHELNIASKSKKKISTMYVLSFDYNVSHATIERIVNHKIWLLTSKNFVINK